MLHLQQCRGFRCQARSPNQFPPGQPGCGTHGYYRRLNEPFPDVLVRLAPFLARYIPWFVLLFSGGAWVALIEHCPHSAREKDTGVMAGGCSTSSSGSSPFRFVAFPIRIQRFRRRRVYVVLDCPLGLGADWSQLNWVRRGVYVRSDCRHAESADCVNWLVATHAWCHTKWLVSEDRDSGCKNLGQLNGSRVSSTGRVWVVFLCLIERARSYTLGYRGGGGITDYHSVFNRNLCLQKVIFAYSTLFS